MSYVPVRLGKPEWWPLEQFVIRQWNYTSIPLTPSHVAKFCSQFLFMGETDSSGETYSLYKHYNSRRYLILHTATIAPYHMRDGKYVKITPDEAIRFVGEFLEPAQKVWATTLR